MWKTCFSASQNAKNSNQLKRKNHVGNRFLLTYFAFISACYTIKFKEQKLKTCLLINSDTLICIWILVFPIGIIQVSTPRKWSTFLYFSSIHDCWHPSSLISIVHNSLGEMEQCEKRALQLLIMQKKEIGWNIKTMCVTEFLLTVRSSSMKDYTCHNVVST